MVMVTVSRANVSGSGPNPVRAGDSHRKTGQWYTYTP